MKKRIINSLVLGLGLCLSLTINAQAANISQLEDVLTDNLTSSDDVKWYSFEMDESGDAEIIIRGLQEHWDGCTNHWKAVIYASDMQTILAEQGVRSYNAEYSSPAKFSLLSLESGTYYIKISIAKTSHFSTDSYQLELNKTYSSTQSFVNSSGDEIYTIGTESFQDRLISADQIRLYAFEMSEPGDVIISVMGLQEDWDGSTYHWRCAVYKDDLETVITDASVRGYTGTYGPSILSASNLDVGTYYVQMASTSSANPLMSSFTTVPYEIQLLKYYYSVPATYSGNDYQTFYNAGDILWSFDGTAFLKLNNGECFGALIKNRDKAIVPILISTDEAAVEYIISNTGERIKAAGPIQHDILDVEFYYSQCGYIDQYTNTSIDTASLPILYVDTASVESAAKKIISKYVEIEYDTTDATAKQEEHDKKIHNILKIAKIGGIIILVIAGISALFGNSSASAHSTGGSSRSAFGGSYGFGTGSFDASSYVSKHCHDHIYGVVSDSDINRIKEDSSLSSSEKEAAIKELEHKAAIYY